MKAFNNLADAMLPLVILLLTFSSCRTVSVSEPVLSPPADNSSNKSPAASVVFSKPLNSVANEISSKEEQHAAEKKDAATIVFLQPETADPDSLREQLTSLAALNPSQIIMFSPQDFSIQTLNAPWLARKFADNLILITPKRPDVVTSNRFFLEPAVGVALFFISAESLSDPSQAKLQGQWFLEQANGTEEIKTAVIVLDEPVWERASTNGWIALQAALDQFRGRLLILSAGAQQAAWWTHNGGDYITIPRISEAEPFANGLTPDVLWAYLSADETILKVLSVKGILPLRFFSRELQDTRKRIVATLASTPLLDTAGTTTITCSNPTSQKLNFETNWQFEDGKATVDPQILGFSLAAGEEFRQQFRFSRDTELPLKFMRPSFVLNTTLNGPETTATKFSMSVTPWCRMTGEVIQLQAAPLIDGKMQEWPGSGYAINHESQVISGTQEWTGPLDLSGRFHAAYADKILFLSGTVQDDQFAAAMSANEPVPVVEIFLDRQQPSNVAEGIDKKLGIGILRIFQTGKFEFIGADKGREGLKVAIQHSDSGLRYEAAIPVTLFAEDRLPSPLLLDVALFDHDTKGGNRTSLFFSGNLQNYHSNQLFAVFSVPEQQK